MSNPAYLMQFLEWDQGDFNSYLVTRFQNPARDRCKHRRCRPNRNPRMSKRSIECIRELQVFVADSHHGELPASKRPARKASVWILGLTMALLAACGGGGSGGSNPPPEPVARPATPTGMTVTAADNQVTVSWEAVSAATSYNIYRSTTAGEQGSTV